MPTSTSSAVSTTGFSLAPLTPAQRETLAKNLTAEERRVLLNQGTEPPFCGGLLNNKESGTYVCKLCGLPLFKSKAKFESGTGWPSFYEPFDPAHIRELKDISHGMVRVEIRCARSMVIWDMCLKMDHDPPACVIA